MIRGTQFNNYAFKDQPPVSRSFCKADGTAVKWLRDYWILNNDKLFMIIFDRHNVMISQKSAVAK